MLGVIGEKCGRLIDIDKCIGEKTLLSHVRVQLKGNKGGIILESIDILCWGKKTTLKLFALNERRFNFHGACTSA